MKIRRVVRTESNYCINQAELKGMKAAGFDEYEFISLGENAENVCDTCDDLDGQRFKIADAVVGVNCPPMHPFCRCKVTTPQQAEEDIQCEIDERIDSWNIPDDMTFDEFVERVNNGELEEIRAEQAAASGENSQELLTTAESGGIIGTGSGKMSIASPIETPIEQRHTGKGNPNAVLTFGIELNNRQKNILDKLPDIDSRVIVPKKSVNMSDLSALTAKTGDEFALFTKGNERLIVRGNFNSVRIDVIQARELAAQGYRWSGHTHPGDSYNCLTASPGDKGVLGCFSHETSVIYNSKGQYLTFNKEG